jgi:signal transduction histidine kinase
VVKHSNTLKARVNFESHDDHLTVIVSDDGKGFSVQELRNNENIGHGLESIHHRLNLLGCNMEVQSEPGRGTQVIITVPYEQLEDQV